MESGGVVVEQNSDCVEHSLERVVFLDELADLCDLQEGEGCKLNVDEEAGDLVRISNDLLGVLVARPESQDEEDAD